MNKDITVGTRIGRLVVISDPFSKPVTVYKKFVKCKCDCGKEVMVEVGSTRKSCGCLLAEFSAKIKKHGMSGPGKSSEYGIWIAMRQRCKNPKNKNFHHYGGRGITVCERWDDFSNFIADMGPKPSNQHSLDRIDNNKGYSPENCRWSNKVEQMRNTRSCVMIPCFGKEMTATEWSHETGVPAGTIIARLKRGWSVKTALFMPT